MPNWVHSAAFRFAIALAMTLGMLLSQIGSSASHNPIALAAAEAARHAELAAQVDNHGHSHDDGEVDEQSPFHSHGHNPADHSHETASMLPYLAPIVPPFGRRWLAYQPSFADLGTGLQLERPPRPIFIA